MMRKLPLILIAALMLTLGAPQASAVSDPHDVPHVDKADAPHGDDAHGESGGGLLDVNKLGAVWNLILFLGLLIVLGKFVWPSILKGLQDREKKIREDLTGAEDANAQAQQTLADYEQKLADAHAEARKLLDQARNEGEQLRRKLQADAEAEIASLRDRASNEIGQAKTEAVQELYAHAGQLAVAVAEKILQRQIDDADTQKLFDESLKQMDKLDESA